MQHRHLLTGFLCALTAANAFGAGNGLKGEYFNNSGLLGPAILTRTDPTIDFTWRAGGPGGGIAEDYFSARWTGQLSPATSGAYKLATDSNNGIRVWLNNTLVIDKWTAHGNEHDVSGAINLAAGQMADLKVEFYQNAGTAEAKLYWIPPGQVQAVVIPQAQLFSTPVAPNSSPAPIYLSTLPPTFQQNGWGPFERDRSNGEQGPFDGGVISIGGVKFSRGLGVHAVSELHYNLAGKYQNFISEIGIDDEVGNRGSVVFQVWLDGVKAFESPTMHGADPASTVSLNVAGKNELKLIVLDGGDGNGYDHSDWADAHLTGGPAVVGGGTPPPSPTNLTATAGDKQIKLDWSPSAGATSYSVFRGTAAGGEASMPVKTGILASEFLDTDLTDGTKYFYKVTAVNSAGSSAMSSEVSATPIAVVPLMPAPTGLTATAGDKQISLKWNAVTGATGYDVFRGTTSNGESSAPVATGLASPAFVDMGLTDGTTYFYRVAALNGTLIGNKSDEVSAKPAAPALPAPTGLTATAGDKQVSLAWAAVTGATSYNVYRGTSSNGESSTPVATGLSTPSFVNTGLTDGTTYFFEVAAVNGTQVGAKSAEVSAKPVAPPPLPAPTGLTATAGDKQVSLTWNAVTGATSYNVYRGTSSNGESSTPVATGLTTPSFVNTGLTDGTTYFFEVAAVNGTAVGDKSAEASAKPAPPPPPPAPTGLTATAGNQQVTLTWTAVTGATSYNVYRGTSSNGESNTALATGLTSATFLDQNLTNGTTYFYKVAAVNANGTSAKSTEASAMPTAPGLQLTQAQKDAFRFLRQTTFGPTKTLVDHVVQVGKSGFLDEQFALPPTAYPDSLIKMPNMELVSEQFFQNAMTGQDQLRQRVGWALSQIFVASAVKVDNTDAMVPYIRLLESEAFGNVKTLLHDVTLTPAMGEFLDMVNNTKANPATGAMPNENYAREVMQLFTIGLVQLNEDGTPVLVNGVPQATYDQSSIADMARVLSGWTYGDNKSTNPKSQNPPFYTGPMKPVESLHDTGQKTVLGQVFPAGQTAEQDLDQAINLLFNHPNIAPFLVRELIQRLVTSNPSPQYIHDVVQVFKDNGQGVRGDLQAVIKAILLHPEASAGVKFSEPALFLTTFCHNICTNITDDPFMSDFSQSMSQQIWFAPSVFNYFSPNFKANGIFAPELQIWSTATALTRANWVASLVSGGFGGPVTLDFSAFTPVAPDPNALLDTVDSLVMGGTMSPQMRQSILTAVQATKDPNERIRTALYLVGASMQYQVEH